jgi:hypothetical protein
MASFMTDFYKIPGTKIKICRPFVTLTRSDTENQLKHLFPAGKKHVVYAGALGEKHYPHGMIKFFRHLLSQRDDIICHIFSAGPIFKDLKYDPGTKNKRLFFHGLVPNQDLWELYTRSDIQVIPEKLGFSNGAIPSKLPNLMAAGVPVLYIGQKDGDVFRMVQSTKAGLCADSWDVDKLSALTNRLLIEATESSHASRRATYKKRSASHFSVDDLINAIFSNH